MFLTDGCHVGAVEMMGKDEMAGVGFNVLMFVYSTSARTYSLVTR